MKIRWTTAAAADFVDAVDYIAADDPGAARGFVERVKESADLLADERFDGPEVTLTTGARARKWVVEPYILFYRRRGGVVELLRLLHGRRRPITR